MLSASPSMVWRRRMGWMSEKQSTGAATFEIHMLAKLATNMVASTMLAGRVTRERMAVAAALAM